MNEEEISRAIQKLFDKYLAKNINEEAKKYYSIVVYEQKYNISWTLYEIIESINYENIDLRNLKEKTGKEIGLDLLQKRLVEESFHEVILATNPTVEGDATANYIAEICHQHNIKVSRIAHGIPVGGELETVDGTTLTHSFLGRRQID